jgi:hypothetical protein
MYAPDDEYEPIKDSVSFGEKNIIFSHSSFFRTFIFLSVLQKILSKGLCLLLLKVLLTIMEISNT